MADDLIIDQTQLDIAYNQLSQAAQFASLDMSSGYNPEIGISIIEYVDAAVIEGRSESFLMASEGAALDTWLEKTLEGIPVEQKPSQEHFEQIKEALLNVRANVEMVNIAMVQQQKPTAPIQQNHVSQQDISDSLGEIRLLADALGVEQTIDAIEQNISARVQDPAVNDYDALAQQVAEEYSTRTGTENTDERVANIKSLLDQREANYEIVSQSVDVSANPAPVDTIPEAAGQDRTVAIVNGLSAQESADIMHKVQGIEDGLAQIAPQLNTLSHTMGLMTLDLSPEQDIPVPSNTQDGVWQQDSVVSFDATMQHLIHLVKFNDLETAAQTAALTTGVGKPAMTGHDVGAFLQNPENIEKMQNLLDTSIQDNIAKLNDEIESESNTAKIAELEADKREFLIAKSQLPSLIKDMTDLKAQGLLDQPFIMTEDVVSSAPVIAPIPAVVPTDEQLEQVEIEALETQANTEQDQLQKDILLVEQILQGLVKEMPEQLGGMMGGSSEGGSLNIAGFDLSSLMGTVDGVLADYTLTDAEVGDGKFGAKENDILATALMGLKTMDGQEGANGVYDGNAKATIEKLFLTSPAFAAMRSNPEVVKQLGAEVQQIPLAEYTQYEKNLQDISSATSQTQQEFLQKKIDDFQEKYAKEFLAAGSITGAIDNLNANNLIDNQKAAQKTQENVGGRLFMQMLDSVGLADFFKDIMDSGFGGMIKAVLGFMGIDVDFIMGETDQERTGAALEQGALDHANKSFDDILTKVQEANPDATFQEQMQAVIADYDSDRSSWTGALKDAGLSAMVGSDNVEFMNNAVDKALDEAEKHDDAEAAKLAFASSLKESAATYNAIPTSERSNDNSSVDAAARAAELAVHAIERGNPGAVSTTRQSNNEQRQEANQPPAGVVIAENTYANIVVKPDETVYEDQDPTRFAHDGVNRVEQMAQYLIEEGAKHGLDEADLAKLQDEEGNAVKVMTPEFNSVIQTLLVDAYVEPYIEEHQSYESGVNADALKEHVSKITEFEPFDDGKPTAHMEALKAHMSGAEGVDAAKLDAMFYAQIQSLATDFDSADDGQTQADSVWEQSFTIGEIIVNIAQYLPQQVAPAQNLDVDVNSVDDITRVYEAKQDPNSTCEIPVFKVDQESGDVTILIRDKQSGDVEAHSVENYLNTGVLPDAVVNELIENYNWQGEVDHAKDRRLGDDAVLGEYTMAEKHAEIIKYMECLGIKAIDTSCVVNSEFGCKAPFNDAAVVDSGPAAILVSEYVRINETANDGRDPYVPDTYDEMRYLRVSDANEIMEALEGKYNNLPTRFEEGKSNYLNGVDRPTLYPGGADGDEANFGAGYLRLEDMFLAQMEDRGAASREAYVVMDLEKMGIEHPDVDMIVAFKTTDGDIDFRFLNNEDDKVMSLAEQKEKGPGYHKTQDDFSGGTRTLDTILAYHKEGIQGPSHGYRGQIEVFTPNNHDGVRSLAALHAVYNDDGELSRSSFKNDYSDSYAKLWNGDKDAGIEGRSAYMVTRTERISREQPEDKPASDNIRAFATGAATSEDVSGQIEQNFRDMQPSDGLPLDNSFVGPDLNQQVAMGGR